MAKKYDKETIEKIHELAKEGLGPSEIGRKLGLGRNTISKHLKSLGITFKKLEKKMNQREFERLWNEGKTDEEIAAYFDVTILTAKTYRTKGENAGKFNIERYFSQTEQKLSHIQEQMILGSLLGDMNLSKPGLSKSVNSRLAIIHCKAQEELFMKKVEILGEFMGNWKLSTPKPDKRTGKVYAGFRGNSKTHKVFTEIRNKLYINDVKTVTQEYLDMINHPIALAYWFMDDGTFEGSIATHSFGVEGNEILKKWMFEKWNINTNLCSYKNDTYLRIPANQRELFENLIKPYIVESMKYKLKFA